AADRARAQQRVPHRGRGGDRGARAAHHRGERRGGGARAQPARPARWPLAPGAAADHRPLPAAARGSRDPPRAAAARAATLRVPDGADARAATRRGARRRDPGAPGGARRTRVARALPRGFRGRAARLCEARAGASRRRRVAQDERAAGGDRCTRQAHRRARPVSAPASPSPLELTASDGRTLAGLVLEAPGARGALAINGATGFRREFYLKFAGYCARRGYHALVYDYRGIGASARRPLAAEEARMSDWGRLD